MNLKNKDIRQRHTELVSRIYAGALNPADYNSIFQAWDAHFQTMLDDQDQLESEDFDWAEEFVRHFEQARLFVDKMASSPQQSVEDFIETLQYPAFVCDANANILFTNRHAHGLMRGLAPQRLFELPFDTGSETKLRTLLSQIKRGANPNSAVPHLMRLFVDSDAEPHILVAELMDNDAFTGNRPDGTLVLLKSVSGVWTADVENALASAFDLTSAELALMSELYRGYSIKEIAEWKGRSQATLRTQLSSALQKTGVKSQAALSRIIAGLVHMVQLKSAQSDGPASLRCVSQEPDQNIDTLVLSNGLVLEYVESGDLKGKPFLFVQPSTTPTLTPEIIDALKRRGIRLISPVRPGVGRTTKAPLDYKAADWAKLYLELLEKLGLGTFTCGGHCSGGIYALELAKLAAGQCNAALLVDTGAPLDNIAKIYAMQPSPRRLFLAARYFPKAITTPIKMVAADFFSSVEGEKRGVEYFYDGSPADQMIINEGQNWQITRDNMEYCFKNVPQLADDICKWSQNTLPLLKKALEHCPVRYLHGGQNLVHSAANILKITNRLPNVSHRLVEEAGQLLIYIEPDVFAEEVAFACDLS